MCKKLAKQPRYRLFQEISTTLLIKFVFIFLLWYFFFSQPVDDSLTPDRLDQHLFNVEKNKVN